LKRFALCRCRAMRGFLIVICIFVLVIVFERFR
jgi:hypothetical protein